MATKAIVVGMKDLVIKNDLVALKEYYEEFKNYDEPIAWDVVYKDVYLHACLKKRREIVTWLLGVYEELDPIMKIGLRQLFPYGRYLLSKT